MRPRPAIDRKLTLVHLSDIHFDRRVVGGMHDLDRDVRNELERDLAALSKRVGPCDGILVTGDIAARGEPSEYVVATAWLTTLTRLLGAPEENVWVVPGNHDVQRAVVERSRVVEMLHRALRESATAGGLDEELRKVLSDPAAGGLFDPLRPYIEFAEKYGCEISPAQPAWERDLLLNDGSVLRLRGVTSVLVSDALDDQAHGKLVVGQAQLLMPRTDGVEYCVLAHHPPQWLHDDDQVQAALCRARVQLFGHKHAAQIQQIDDCVRVAAGATHPSRAESAWLPRYNLLRLDVLGGAEHRRLRVEVFAREWSDGRTFRADRNPVGDAESRTYELPLGPWRPPQAPTQSAAASDVSMTADARESVAERRKEGGRMDPRRRLTYRFLSLPYHVRLAIAQDLELLIDEDKGVADGELFRRFLTRARDRGQLGALWRSVEERHGVMDTDENPFDASE